MVIARLAGNRSTQTALPTRSRLQVFDPPAQALRVVHELPDGPNARQAIASLRRLDRQGTCAPTLIDCQLSQGQWKLLTTWVEGETLAVYLNAARDGKKPWPSVYETVRMYRQFVHSLCQFHQFTGRLHGDISPANLIVQAQPHALRLIDFGSAWPMSDSEAKHQGEGATPGYSAPERLTPAIANHLADQFSASIVLYEMLTGQLPYEGMGGRAGEPEYRDTFADAYKPPSHLAAKLGDCPQQAWALIDALAREGLRLLSEERYQNSGQWRQAADAAWEQVRLPSSLSVTGRIGEAVANWIERMTKGKES